MQASIPGAVRVLHIGPVSGTVPVYHVGRDGRHRALNGHALVPFSFDASVLCHLQVINHHLLCNDIVQDDLVQLVAGVL